MADCSKTEVFFEEWNRLCRNAPSQFFCTGCECQKLFKSYGYKNCAQMMRHHAKELIEFVQKWSDEHPLPKPKTYEDELKKILPASLLYRKNMDGKQEVNLCRQMLFDSEPPYCNGYIVDKVCMKCWNEPYPEQEATT